MPKYRDNGCEIIFGYTMNTIFLAKASESIVYPGFNIFHAIFSYHKISQDLSLEKSTIDFSFLCLYLSATGLYRCAHRKCLLIIGYTLYKIGELKKNETKSSKFKE